MTGPSVQERKVVRKAFAALVTAELTAEHINGEVYAFQKSRFDGQTPVICVVSGASDRVTVADRMILTESELQLRVHNFVRYQDADGIPPWTEENSEDQIDDLETLISNIVLACGGPKEPTPTQPWLNCWTVGSSEMTRAIFEGIDYRHESIVVTFQVDNVA
jgi:hypothetical protein